MYLGRQWLNGHNRFKELRRYGVSRFRAAVAAGSPTGPWRMSGHPAVHCATTFSILSACLDSTLRIEAQPGRTAEVREPYARWCGCQATPGTGPLATRRTDPLIDGVRLAE